MVENAEYTFPGVILAGGRSRRMGGGDKCLTALGERPLLAHVIDRIRPQVTALALNANGDPARFAAFALDVIPDDPPDFAGPLAGILASLDWASRTYPTVSHLLTVPADTPFLPRDLVARLTAALPNPDAAAIAQSQGRVHPVVGLWPCARREELRHALRSQGMRKVEDWSAGIGATAVDFTVTKPGLHSVDPFFNVNSPSDLATALRFLESGSTSQDR
jgi:molybdenum cofactor guanylyltransferase